MEQQLSAFIYPLILFAVLGVLAPLLLSNAADNARNTSADDAPDEKTLYDQLGGAEAINAAVDIFYRRVLSDAYIKEFFATTDMAKQAIKQKAFLTMVFGGPNGYTGLDMREGHKHLVDNMGLNESHFEHVLAHLRSTLAELGVSEDKVAEVIAIADSVRDDVLNR